MQAINTALNIPYERLVHHAGIESVCRAGPVYSVDEVAGIAAARTGKRLGRTLRRYVEGVSKVDGSRVTVDIDCTNDGRPRYLLLSRSATST